MSALPRFNLTPEECLSLERQAEFKSEYYDGLAYVLAGASEKHNTIAGNCFAELHAKLKGRGCKVYTNDLKVRLPHSRKFFYP
jgi:Uma2 family endonuclease